MPGSPHKQYPACWNTGGRSTGPSERNTEMHTAEDLRDSTERPARSMRITINGETLVVVDKWDERRLARKKRRMERNRAFIARCERLTGKRFETYAEACEAWDEAGLFLFWRRWAHSRERKGRRWRTK